MSDLQCAARFLVLAGETADSAWLRTERVAAVYGGPTASGVESAGTLAREVGAVAGDLRTPVRLAEARQAVPETVAVLRELADLHRGETVVVLAPPAVGGAGCEVLLDGDGVAVSELATGRPGEWARRERPECD